MGDELEPIDEVAFKVLFAEGLNVTTAWVASRPDDGGSEPGALGWTGVLVLLVVAIAVLAAVLL
jgi:hypothetical protein